MINPLLFSEEDIEIYDTFDEDNIKRLYYLICIKDTDFYIFDEIWDKTVVDNDKLNLYFDESVEILDKITGINGFTYEIDAITNEILEKYCPVKKRKILLNE